MRKQLIFALAIGFGITALSCGKFNCNEKDDRNEDFGNESAMLILDDGYTSEVTSELKKSDDYDYFTEGIIEYKLNGEKIAELDFGKGDKDIWVDFDQKGTKGTCDLSGKKKNSKYKKVITSPLIKLTDCDYIVAGVIEYYKGGTLVATVDFGDGTCDDLAIKTWPAGSNNGKSWPAGSKVFNLKWLK